MKDDPHKPNLVGWCDTPQGFMMVFECPDCFEKYRFHGNCSDLFDIDMFDHYTGLYALGERVANGEDLWEKYTLYNQQL